jgi:probable rRNA maturation factor
MVTVNGPVDAEFGTAKQIAAIVKRVAGRGKREVSITFVRDPEIRKLNRKYRGIDRATDVLSFPMDDEDVLGDIVISADTAKRNAKRYGVTPEKEVKRLLVHGTLHLLGYDHVKMSDRALMRKMEERFMKNG